MTDKGPATKYIDGAIDAACDDGSLPLDIFERPVTNERGRQHRRLRGSRDGTTASEDIAVPMSRTYSYYDSVFSLQGAGPLRPAIVEALDSVYVGSFGVLASAVWDEANQSPGQRTPILLLGAAGCGKTTLQNQFLNQSTEALRARSMLWIRCDANKLYNVWQHVGAGTISIQDYLDLQLVYVACKYSRLAARDDYSTIPFFEMMMNDLEGTVVPLHREDRSPENYTARFEEIVHKFRERIAVSRSAEQAALEAIRNYHSPGNDRKTGYIEWTALVDVIKKYLAEHRYSLLKIVDGIDNILWHRSRSKGLYDTMMTDVATIANRAQEDVWVLSMRPGTYRDLGQEVQQLFRPVTAHDRFNHCRKINLTSPAFDEILAKKSKVCIEPLPAQFAMQRQALEQGPETSVHVRTADRTMAMIIGAFVGALDDLIAELLPGEDFGSTPADRIREVFGEDVRALTANAMFMLLIAMRTPEIRDTPARLKRWIYRNLFLNGSFFPKSDPRDAPGNRRAFLPNIFWFDTADLPTGMKTHWHGLCALRLLQTLPKLGYPCPRKDLVDEVVLLFDYSTSVVQRTLDRLLLTGLMQYKLQPGPPERGRHDDDPDFQVLLRRTHLARLTVALSFGRADILYFLALDTPLVHGDSVLSHSNNHPPSRFVEATVNTSLWMMKHINTWHGSEMEYLRTVLAKRRESQNARFPHPISDETKALEDFSLPSVFPGKVKTNLCAMLNSLSMDKRQFYTILRTPYPRAKPTAKI